jgi:hypothetical protein
VNETKGGIKMTKVGTWWNDRDIDLVKINGKVYALYGWNGEEWAKSWECTGNQYMDSSKETYVIKPIYEEDADGDFEIVGYELV